MNTEKLIKNRALDIGFNLVGITDLSPSLYQNAYREWIEKGFHADMQYLERTEDIRLKPDTGFPWAKSIIMVAVNYYQGPIPEPDKGELKISRYALGKDYHLVIEEMLHSLSDFLISETRINKTRYYTDTGSILEKEFAQRAGLGWIGKNTILITRDFGSWIFLGELLVDIELKSDTSSKDRCGDCTLCVDSCPSEALIKPYTLKSNLCTAYQTVENNGKLPEWYPSRDNPYLFGCDICQNVCPFNKNVKKTKINDFIPDEKIVNPELEWIEKLTASEFMEIFRDKPLSWTGWDKFRRNLKSFRQLKH